MIFAQWLSSTSFTRSKRIDTQDKETQFGTADATGLNNGILFCSRPVSVNVQDRRTFARLVRNISIRRHPDARPGLKNKFLNAIPFTLESAKNTRLQIAGGCWKAPPRLQQILAKRDSLPLPFFHRSGRPVIFSKFRRLLLNERLKGSGRFLSDRRNVSYEQRQKNADEGSDFHVRPLFD